MVHPAGHRGGYCGSDGWVEAPVSQGGGPCGQGAREGAPGPPGRDGQAPRQVSFTIRRYVESDQAAVRALFIAVNRELATPALREAFETYLAVSLCNEIERLTEYYAEKQ